MKITRFPRFGIRALFVVLFLCSLWLAWMSSRNRQVRIERVALEKLERQGVAGYWAFDFDAQEGRKVPRSVNYENPTPSWLSSLFDQYPFARVVIFSTPEAVILESVEEIGKFEQLKSLHIDNGLEIRDFGSLANLTRLERLTLGNCPHLESISCLANCRRLNYLYVSGADLKDISVVRRMPGLKELTLRDSTVSDLSALEPLKQLETMAVAGNFRNLNGLQGKKSLKSLTLESDKLNDFSTLSSLPNLRVLNLKADQLRSLESLEQLKNLEVLNIESRNLVSLEGIGGLTNLRELNLVGCVKLADVSQLRGLNISLLKICIHRGSENRETIHLDDLSGIEDLKNLVKLDLSGCSMKDFSQLRDLERLQRLQAKHCKKLQTLDGVQELASLIRIELDQCDRLTNLDGLAGLPDLDILDCYHCDSLSDISALITVPRIRRANFCESKNVRDAEFFLEMAPTAFVARETEIENDPSSAFLNLKDTAVPGEQIEQLRRKFPNVEVLGNAKKQSETNEERDIYEDYLYQFQEK